MGTYNLCFRTTIRQIIHTQVLLYQKWGAMGYKLHGRVYMMDQDNVRLTLHCLSFYLLHVCHDSFPSTFWEIQTAHNHISRVVRKPAFCICENKDADQLRDNREADQRLCFRYTDSRSLHFLNPKFQASSHLR